MEREKTKTSCTLHTERHLASASDVQSAMDITALEKAKEVKMCASRWEDVDALIGANQSPIAFPGSEHVLISEVEDSTLCTGIAEAVTNARGMTLLDRSIQALCGAGKTNHICPSDAKKTKVRQLQIDESSKRHMTATVEDTNASISIFKRQFARTPKAARQQPKGLIDAARVKASVLRKPHSRAADESRKKIFLCEESGCGKKFERRYNLKVHMRRHTGETPYHCIEILDQTGRRCKGRFRWRSSLRHHNSSVHKKKGDRKDDDSDEETEKREEDHSESLAAASGSLQAEDAPSSRKVDTPEISARKGFLTRNPGIAKKELPRKGRLAFVKKSSVTKNTGTSARDTGKLISHPKNGADESVGEAKERAVEQRKFLNLVGSHCSSPPQGCGVSANGNIATLVQTPPRLEILPSVMSRGGDIPCLSAVTATPPESSGAAAMPFGLPGDGATSPLFEESLNALCAAIEEAATQQSVAPDAPQRAWSFWEEDTEMPPQPVVASEDLVLGSGSGEYPLHTYQHTPGYEMLVHSEHLGALTSTVDEGLMLQLD